MSLYDMPNFTGSGIDEAFVDISTSVSAFAPMLLFFIFMVVMITGYRKQKSSTGFGDAPLWATLAGIVTTMSALLLTTVSGIVSLPTLVITIVITISCGLWLFMSKDRI